MLASNSLGALGYVLAALLTAILGALLLTTWRGRLQGGLLLGGVSANTIWAAMLAVQTQWHTIPAEAVWAAEALRMLAWLIFLLRLLNLLRYGSEGNLRLLRLGVVIGCIVLMLPFEMQLHHLLPVAASDHIGSLRLIGLVVLMVTGLFLVEQIYRTTPWQHRWGIKFLCFGLGSLFAYDFFFFADALLFAGVDSGLLLARGAVNAMVVPLIALSVARNPQWSFDLSVSRSVVIHSTTLVAAGVYLLFMALAGYYIRYHGGEWTRIFQPLFLFGAGLLLIILLFSGQLRSLIKVFVTKHFFSYRYDYREEWLKLISVLSGKVLQASLPERIVFALSALVESPGGAIWVIAEDGNYAFEQCWNLPESEVERRWNATSFCTFLRHSTEVIDLAAIRNNEALANKLLIPDWMRNNSMLWLLIPLFHEERLMGFVILSKARVPQMLDWENKQLLNTAARQAASYLALEEAASALAQARQFEGFNRLAAFVMHDLKNLIAQLSLITRNAERYGHNKEFVDDAFQTVGDSVDRMNRLLAQLRAAAASEREDSVDLRAMLVKVVSHRAIMEPRPKLQIDDKTAITVSADADRLSAILANVIQNAQDATPKDGQIEVRLSVLCTEALIEVIDNGCGMDETFIRQRLFRPFDSTKGLSGMGIGAYECREFINMLGGRIEVESQPGKGTCFRLFIPAEPVVDDHAAAPLAVNSVCKIQSRNY